jgi:hypothetical protein
MHGFRPWLLITALCIATPSLWAAPQINNVSQRGVKIGESSTLIFDGAELSPDARLITNLPLKSQQTKPDATANRVAVVVVVDDAAQPGIYAVRLASASGISNPVLIAVDRLPQKLLSEQVETLPVALSGNLSGSEVKKIIFVGQKDQAIVIDVEAQRLGANFKPVLRLYDERGRQITSGVSQPWLGGDARCIAKLPDSGKYTVELHDRSYRAGGPGMFRLKIGEIAVADRVHPAAVSLGQSAKLSFLGGNVPAGVTFDFTTTNQTPGNAASPWPLQLLAAGLRPNVLITDQPEIVEAPVAGGLQDVGTASVGIHGILAAAGEEDRYLLNVAPNQKLRVEVQARRLGSPIDGVLSLRNEQGGQLAGGDDVPGSLDPKVNAFTVPANTTKLVVAVKDLHGRGGSDFNYRINVRDLGKPDFALSLGTDRILIPSAGTQVIPVTVERTSYNGPIQLELVGLPSSIQVQGAEIAAGASTGLLALSAPAGTTGAGLLRIIGRGANEAASLVRTAQAPALPGSQLAPYLRDEIAWSVAPASTLTVAWSPSGDMLLQGVAAPANVQLTRAAGTPGPIRLRLLTTQPPVKKTIKENNQNKEVDDLARMLRLEKDVVVAADKNESGVAIYVPGDLPVGAWDAALVAELLSADGKNVVATAYAPARRFQVQPPLRLELSSPNAAEGKAGAGAAGKFIGKVNRAAGYQRPVVVTLAGLPQGYVAPLVEVPDDKAEFELPLTFPFGSKPGELKNVQLIAVQDRNNPAAPRSNAIVVSVNLTPGEKPPAEKPHAIFEDDEQFIALLTEGGGQIRADGEKHSGKISLRVTPDQKYSATMPGVEVKIRENPGPGEYRYLRFAWRKKQGNAICLQLAHEGQFGPGGNTRAGAKFRYHAGPGAEPFGGSVLVDGKLPGQYVVVTRDLFADFGEFTLTGFAFSAIDGQAAYFDGIYVGRTPGDFELIETK